MKLSIYPANSLAIIRTFVIFAVLLLLFTPGSFEPAPAATGTFESIEAGTAAVNTARPLLRTAGVLAEVPASAAGILQLPLGALEIVFSPLPGASFMNGLKNVVSGTMAPLQLAGTVLRVPFKLLDGLAGAQ